MLSDIFRSRWVVGALILALLSVVGSYFGGKWWHSRDDFHHESTKVEDKKRIFEADTSAPAVDASAPAVDVPAQEAESLAPATESSTPVAESSVPVNSSPQTAEADRELDSTDPAKVSPYGFGPYPEVPASFPNDVIWSDALKNLRERWSDERLKNLELMHRVLIKLWTQGYRASSATMDDGKMYPLFPNTVYVRWEEYVEDDGTISREATRIKGPGDIPDSVLDALGDGIVPPGIKILSLDEDWIDPYEFLKN